MRVIARGDESVKSCISGRRGTRDGRAVKPPWLDTEEQLSAPGVDQKSGVVSW